MLKIQKDESQMEQEPKLIFIPTPPCETRSNDEENFVMSSETEENGSLSGTQTEFNFNKV